MSGLSLDVLRVGKKYRIVNYGDRHEVVIEEKLSTGEFRVKDLHTLERYPLSEIYRYGKGKDFEIRDLE
jgi:hypothetical protein